MEILLGVLGVVMFVFVSVDIIWTTLWVDGGAGPLTKGVSNVLWQLLKQIDRNGRVLKFSGPITLISILGFWILLSWVSCFLIFNFFDAPLINTINDRPLNHFDLFYFTGYTLFTFGNGEFAPSSAPVQMIASVVSAYGLVTLTLGISYIIGVIDGVVQQRSLASGISAMGNSCEDFLITCFDGEGFYDLSSYLDSVSSNLSMVIARQKAYPLLSYYRSSKPTKALSYVLPILADSLLVVKFGLKHQKGVNQAFVKISHSAIEDYISTSTTFHVDAKRDIHEPPIPNYEKLVDAGIPLVGKEKFAALFEEAGELRTQLQLIKLENFETELSSIEG